MRVLTVNPGSSSIKLNLLTVVAFFAIPFTGWYPRFIFEFNVGVLRRAWRVAFYGYGALGTDQYPPFTLKDVPHYPAAIPHYLVIALFTGGGDGTRTVPGLVGVPVLREDDRASRRDLWPKTGDRTGP